MKIESRMNEFVCSPRIRFCFIHFHLPYLKYLYHLSAPRPRPSSFRANTQRGMLGDGKLCVKEKKLKFISSFSFSPLDSHRIRHRHSADDETTTEIVVWNGKEEIQ